MHASSVASFNVELATLTLVGLPEGSTTMRKDTLPEPRLRSEESAFP
jgi:hypothetical protein